MLVRFKYPLGFILLLVFILTGCSEHGPSKNPTPQYYMTVDGYLAPSLVSKINLTWLVSYNTTNPACRVTVNSFEGIAAPRQKTLKYPVKQSGNYQLKLPLDYYLPGRCGWQLATINYVGKQAGTKHSLIGATVAFYKPYAQGNKSAKSLIVCDCQLKQCSCDQKSATYFNNMQDIGVGNYHYSLIIRSKNYA